MGGTLPSSIIGQTGSKAVTRDVRAKMRQIKGKDSMLEEEIQTSNDLNLEPKRNDGQEVYIGLSLGYQMVL